MMTIAKIVTKTLDVGVKDTKIDLSATIKSYDLTDTKFIFNIISNQGLNIDLMGSTAIYIVEYVHNSQNYAIQGEVDIVDSTTIAFSLPEDLKGYRGNAIIGLYVQMADGTKIDLKDIVVKIEPSIMDKGIDFTAKTYFEDFETVKAEVISVGENAKNQINAVLPTVQAQVSELDRQIKALPQIPDLFVAYADDINGGGFSKTDNTKMYKGYGVKNSNLATDYRWERNVEDLSTGGDNLIINGAFPTNTHDWYFKTNGNGTFEVRQHSFYFNEKKTMFCIINSNKVAGYEGQEECVAYSNLFNVKPNTDYTLSFVGFVSANTSSTQIHYLGGDSRVDVSYPVVVTLFDKNVVMPSGTCQYYQITFNSRNSDVGYIRFDNNGSTDGNDCYMFFSEVMLVEGRVAKKYQPSSTDLTLNSNPINSILTTLSAENPSTMLGGTWVQLGTESKFDNTIYYWKRTQ